MEVDDNLESKTSGPIDSSIDIDTRSSDVRRTEGVVCPVSDGNTDDIEPRLLNLVKVLPGDPSVPMATKNAKRGLVSKLLSQRVLCDLSVSSLLKRP